MAVMFGLERASIQTRFSGSLIRVESATRRWAATGRSIAGQWTHCSA